MTFYEELRRTRRRPWFCFVLRSLILMLLLSLSHFELLSGNDEVRIIKSIENVRPAFAKDNVSIVFGCDDNYAMYLGVCILSLIETSSAEHNYDIWVLDGGISNDTREGIVSLIKGRRNFSIRFFDISDFVEKNREKFRLWHHHVSIATYFRLFVPKIFISYWRILYLDCDMIINTDIAKLFNIDLEGNSVGAVSNARWYLPCDQQRAKKIKGDKWEVYFSPAVLLFNIEKTVKENVTERCLEYLSATKNNKGAFFEDQDTLNAVILDSIKLLDRKWLALVRVKTTPPRLDDSFILHYNQKPWCSYVPLDDLWWSFAAKTPFYRRIIEKNWHHIISHKIQIQSIYILASLLRLSPVDNLARRFLPRIQPEQLYKKVSALKDMSAFKHLINLVKTPVNTR